MHNVSCKQCQHTNVHTIIMGASWFNSALLWSTVHCSNLMLDTVYMFSIIPQWNYTYIRMYVHFTPMISLTIYKPKQYSFILVECTVHMWTIHFVDFLWKMYVLMHTQQCYGNTYIHVRTYILCVSQYCNMYTIVQITYIQYICVIVWHNVHCFSVL